MIRKLVGGADKPVKNARLAEGMPRAPSTTYGSDTGHPYANPRGAERTWHIIPSVDDHPRNILEFCRRAQPLVFLQSSTMDEIMVFDTGKSNGEIILVILLAQRGIGNRVIVRLPIGSKPSLS